MGERNQPMKYERTIIDGSVFGLTNAQFSRLPELPMLEYKAGKWKIKVTDMRCLNETAVDTFEKCLTTAATENGATEAVFDIGDIDENTLNLVADICMAAKYEARKRGYYVGGCFIIGCERPDGKIAFQLNPKMAKAAYNYVQQKGCGLVTISLPDLVLEMIEMEEKEA